MKPDEILNRKKRPRRERFREIVSVLARHGIRNGIKSVTDPAQVREALEELGPTFIKIGQVLSMRRDILPEAYLKEFEKLQDNVRPENFSDIKRAVEESLHKNLSEVFPVFEKEAIASASLSEVHRARLANGRDVVVKVQRPKARETMMSDIAILKTLSRLGWFLPKNNIISFRELIEEIEATTAQELDFLNEKENIKRFGRNNQGVRYIICPTVYEEYTTSTVLVMDRLDGIKIDDTEAIGREGYDLAEIGTKLADNYLKQIFEDGFFHADPHPGNLLICGKQIAFLDFGIMGTLSAAMRSKLDSFLYGLATNDVGALTNVVLRIGIIKGEVNRERIYSDIDELYGKYSAVTIDEINLPELFREVFSVCKKNSIAIPRELTMLAKGMVTMEGVLAKIAPDMNLTRTVISYSKKRFLKGKDARRDLSELVENLSFLYSSGARISSRMMGLLNSMLNGKFTIRMEYKDHEQNMDKVNRMVNRIAFSMIVSALIIGSSLLVHANAGPKIVGVPVIGLAGYAGAAVFGFWLLISILRSNRI